MKQLSFIDIEYAQKKKQTKRDRFLNEMNQVIPWARLLKVIEPHYPKTSTNGGRPPMRLETMLRIYFLQNGTASQIREPKKLSMT